MTTSSDEDRDATREEWPRVVTRLFLSADISGSTAYKQQRTANAPLAWPTPFIEFYRQYPGTFFGHWENGHAAHGNPHPAACGLPQIWKAIGDELVMHQEVSSESAVACSVDAWINAIREFRERRIFKEHNLGLKGAAWLATFPDPNFEVMIPRDQQDAEGYDSAYPLASNRDAVQTQTGTLDFLGPSIDIGFRLASKATTRRFPVSFELADVLAHITDANDKAIHLRHDRDMYLKGVHHDAEYPFFWIDIGDSELDKAIDTLHHLPPYEKEHVKAVAAAAYKDRKLQRPYLPNAKTNPFKGAGVASPLAQAAARLRAEAAGPTKGAELTGDPAGSAPVPESALETLLAGTSTAKGSQGWTRKSASKARPETS